MTKKNQTSWADELTKNSNNTASKTEMKLVATKEKEETRRLNCYVPVSLYQEIMAYQYNELTKSGQKPTINSIVINAVQEKIR